MRIAAVQAYHLRAKLPEPIFDARSEITERAVVLVRIRSADGAEGWGEAACFGGVGQLVVAAVEHLAGRLVDEPVRPRDVARTLLRGSAHYGQRGVVVSAVSGIELALWDLLGHGTGRSASTLLGAARRPVGVYGTAGFYVRQGAEASLERLEQELLPAAEGLSGVKIKIGRFGLRDDETRIRRARELLGDDRILVADANNAYSVADAARLAARVADCGLHFLEEPVPFGSPQASAELRRRSSTPVSGYELEPTYEGCRPYIEQRAVDYVQPDATWSGGLLECLSIADLAARRGVGFIPHNFSGVFGTAANYHAASIGGAALLELDRTGGPLGDLGLLLEQGWSLENGCLTAPDRPGLGLRVTEEWIEEHAIEV